MVAIQPRQKLPQSLNISQPFHSNDIPASEIAKIAATSPNKQQSKSRCSQSHLSVSGILATDPKLNAGPDSTQTLTATKTRTIFLTGTRPISRIEMGKFGALQLQKVGWLVSKYPTSLTVQ